MSRQHHYLTVKAKHYKEVDSMFAFAGLYEDYKHYQIGDLVHIEEVINGVHTGRSFPAMEIKNVVHCGTPGADCMKVYVR